MAGPDHALHEAINFGTEFVIEYCTVGQQVTTTSGLPLGQMTHYSKVSLDKGDYLMIPGSDYDFFLQNRSNSD